VEEGMTCVKLDNAHGPGIGIGEDGLCPTIGDDLFIAIHDFSEGLVPRNGHERPLPLFPHPFQGAKYAKRGVNALSVVSDLHADGAPGKGMVRVSFDRHHPPTLHPHKEAAGVRAVVRAHRAFIDNHVYSPVDGRRRIFVNIRDPEGKRQAGSGVKGIPGAPSPMSSDPYGKPWVVMTGEMGMNPHLRNPARNGFTWPGGFSGQWPDSGTN
jgi:hypothetical protein